MPNSPKPSAAVIGSGFGGLAVAIRLAAAGYATVIYERHDKPGGRAYVFKDQGFTFDAGPTVVTAPDCLEELFTLAGKKMSDYVELMPVSPMYRLLWEDGTTFDYHADEETLLAAIAKISPEDVPAYHRFYKNTWTNCANVFVLWINCLMIPWSTHEWTRVWIPRIMKLSAENLSWMKLSLCWNLQKV